MDTYLHLAKTLVKRIFTHYVRFFANAETEAWMGSGNALSTEELWRQKENLIVGSSEPRPQFRALNCLRSQGYLLNYYAQTKHVIEHSHLRVFSDKAPSARL